MAHRLDGRAAADRLLSALKKKVRRSRRPIRLATILVGQRFDSALYVRLKVAAAQRVGITTEQHRLPQTVSQQRLEYLISRLNRQKTVHGILLQLPLPRHLNVDSAIRRIDPKKDVDGFHPDNRFVVPPPVAAVFTLINLGHPPRRSAVVIVGRPSVYTKQLTEACERRGWTAKVVTRAWSRYTKNATIIITALGRGPKLTAAHVSRRAIIIDVGIRHEHGKTVGDVASDVWTKARAISPVPGGVGPLTVACVLQNTYQLAKLRT